ncbi:MAG: 1,2-phenylacetyl-CoA epoxidase subunit PaaD [Acidimicrobiia bacterium]
MVTVVDRVEEIRTSLDAVTDPEIPVLSIADIGILRDVAIDEGGTVVVTITPTYSGCPALEVIQGDIARHLAASGYTAQVDVSYTPEWTTDWMSDAAKDKLRATGIAPPGVLGVVDEVLCPRCASADAQLISEFGSTACKRLMVCTTCGEPFDQFKAI